MRKAILITAMVLMGAWITLAQDMDHLSDAEIQAAMSTKSTHFGHLMDQQGLMRANFVGCEECYATPPAIDLFMPDTLIYYQALNAKKQFVQYKADEFTTLRALTVIANGASVGTTSGPSCDSVIRIVLIDDVKSPNPVVVESVASKNIASTFQNGFGATAVCSSVVAKFMLRDVAKVMQTADKGQFFVGVFYAGGSKKVYKLKQHGKNHGELTTLGLVQ